MSGEAAQHKLAIPECRLGDGEFGAQLRRYRELSRHVEQIERRTGFVTVRFDGDVRAELLEHTLSVERDCCPFLEIDYDVDARELTITVENISQDPRLDSLFHALAYRPQNER